MRSPERKKQLVLMVLHLLWGLILLISISKYGPGVSSDAVHLLFGAENLAAGKGLTSHTGAFISQWPPLYSVLLSGMHVLTGLDMLTVASIVQVMAFLLLSAALTILFERIFRQQFGLAIAASLLAQVGSVMVLGFGIVGSDYVHLSIVMAGLALLGRYLDSGSPRALAGLAAVSILAMLQRYIGVALIATAMTAIAIWGRGKLWQRLQRMALLGATAVPAAVWFVATSGSSGMRGPITFSENFTWFSASLLEWFFGPLVVQDVPAIAIAVFWILVLGFAVAALRLARNPEYSRSPSSGSDGTAVADARPYVGPLLLYGLMYSAALFGSAAIAFFNKLGGRFLLPLYIPFITVPVLLAEGLLRRSASAASSVLRRLGRWLPYIGLGVLFLTLLRITYPIIVESTRTGVAGGDNVFNNSRWHDDPVIRYWRAHQPRGEFMMLSNDPDGVAFHTSHAVQYSPRKYAGPYDDEKTRLGSYKDEILQADSDVYLFWVENTARDYYFSPDDLAEIIRVEPLFTAETGGIFLLLPPETE